MTPIKVVLVDDHHVVRRGLNSFLSAFDDIEIIGEAAGGEEALARIAQWLPDVAVVDLLLPGGIDGIETARHIRAASPHTKIVMLTAYGDQARVIGALRAGAIGYVKKDSEPETLLMAIRAAANEQSVLEPSIAGIILRDLTDGPGAEDPLSERELEVLKLLAHGHTNAEIASLLIIGEETVKTHVGNILSKLHIKHRMQAVIRGLKKGLLSLDDIDV
ncbi:MAG: response regulator transcription factor [Anaerolineae bacterium]|nr:response regulator transcription factor [Anaerolineae bacterium]